MYFSESEAPSLHRRWPVSSVLRASPPSATARFCSREPPVDHSEQSRQRTSRVACRSPCLRATAITPVDETDRRLYFDPPLLPSPYGWRFGVHDWHFRGLLDNSLHVVARKLARPPKAAFSHRRLPTVCYLPIGFNCFLMDNLLSGVGLTPTGIRQTLARRTPAAPARVARVTNHSSTNTYKLESCSNSTTFGTRSPCSRCGLVWAAKQDLRMPVLAGQDTYDHANGLCL